MSQKWLAKHFKLTESYMSKLITGELYNQDSKPFNLRMPKELKNTIELKAKNEKFEVAEFTRAVLTFSVLPEILQSELKNEACDWITKQGKNSIEVHFGEKINKLKQIIENATFAIEETQKLQQKFIDAEVECLNKISEKLDN